MTDIEVNTSVNNLIYLKSIKYNYSKYNNTVPWVSVISRIYRIQRTLVITKCLGPVNSFVISDIRYKRIIINAFSALGEISIWLYPTWL